MDEDKKPHPEHPVHPGPTPQTEDEVVPPVGGPPQVPDPIGP